ncbi:hypothetical protein BT96DRAFT_433298 [Gymnopus androsaceus JB14]|uniref:Uncharacterized protein n=1 Tax=Gymnopus androsaceus JB14 TaxID=1447944 RepID=A0A6A4I1I7_9AGAR|nr:hypothetical protein BT96DRAFT_433298 [Gymnopus androsaceus JB14]
MLMVLLPLKLLYLPVLLNRHPRPPEPNSSKGATSSSSRIDANPSPTSISASSSNVKSTAPESPAKGTGSPSTEAQPTASSDGKDVISDQALSSSDSKDSQTSSFTSPSSSMGNPIPSVTSSNERAGPSAPANNQNGGSVGDVHVTSSSASEAKSSQEGFFLGIDRRGQWRAQQCYLYELIDRPYCRWPVGELVSLQLALVLVGQMISLLLLLALVAASLLLLKLTRRPRHLWVNLLRLAKIWLLRRLFRISLLVRAQVHLSNLPALRLFSRMDTLLRPKGKPPRRKSLLRPPL